MKKHLRTIFATLFVLAALYLLFWPVPINPQAWTPPAAPKLEGVYAVNEKLAAAERLGTGVGIGPETVSVDAQGRLYAGYVDGRIVRFAADGSDPQTFAHTGGRPVGHRFDAAGNLIVADAAKGLLSISPAGKISTLTTQQGGVPFGLTDDVEPGADGNYYFSDATSKFPLGAFMLDVLEHGANGRLLVYDPRTRATRLLLDGLYFANGVAVAPDASFVLVAETTEYRVRRVWLQPHRGGQRDIFIDNLPGFPDGISSNGHGIFWLAIVAPRDPQLDSLLPHPFLRKIMFRLHLPEPPLRRHAMVLGLDAEGRVVYNLQDPSPVAYAPITAVQESHGMLYLGSFSENSFARFPIPQK
ncbi:MAG: SMP-30/gluconolactonase/LRE family protein [Acidobacteria bacterium]|nr:SMP-30/gluconolactonase/LRE family protein [Acidobacteriota bacterium]MCL5287209.1 SMP-30/gluconolactonase/LRE family protein [Acidobacteriota bacterium]